MGVIVSIVEDVNQLSADLRKLFKSARDPVISLAWHRQNENMPTRTLLDKDNITPCLRLMKLRDGADVIVLLDPPTVLVESTADEGRLQ